MRKSVLVVCITGALVLAGCGHSTISKEAILHDESKLIEAGKYCYRLSKKGRTEQQVMADKTCINLAEVYHSICLARQNSPFGPGIEDCHAPMSHYLMEGMAMAKQRDDANQRDQRTGWG